MDKRSLARIERVISVEPIEGADRIEKITILGWQVVCKKGDVKPNDLCCYIEIDSIVKDIPYFSFMKERKFRIKTIRLRKQISQGLVIPLKDLNTIENQLGEAITNIVTLKEGIDITNLLQIKKYESPSDKESNWQSLSKKKHLWVIRYLTRYQWFRKLFHVKSKSFPSWIGKTNEERLQNMPWILNDKTCEWYFSEKLDGCSATYWYKHKLIPEFGICSRTVRKSEHDGSNWARAAKQFNIKEKLKKCEGDYAVQGEIIGPKIQDGKYYNSTRKSVETPLDFYIFNVYDIKNKKYLTYYNIMNFCTDHGFKMVPIIEHSCYLKNTIQEMLKYAEGESSLANIQREGIVCRKINQLISFKVVNNKYLLREENN